jgi:hypothetical protein
LGSQRNEIRLWRQIDDCTVWLQYGPSPERNSARLIFSAEKHATAALDQTLRE